MEHFPQDRLISHPQRNAPPANATNLASPSNPSSPPRPSVDLQTLLAKRSDDLQRIRRERLRLLALGLAVGGQLVLLLIALIPQSIWADHGLPAGPIPAALAPLVAALYYLFPTLTGLLCRRWQIAILLATFPAWLDLGLFAVAAAGRIGPFYLAQEAHAGGTASTLELFAALGALGWLARFGIASATRHIRRYWRLWRHWQTQAREQRHQAKQDARWEPDNSAPSRPLVTQLPSPLSRWPNIPEAQSNEARDKQPVDR